MRIGIDATAAYCQGAGIGRYTRELIRALAEVDRENEYRLFRPRQAAFSVGALPPNFQERVSRLPEHTLAIIWHRLRLPLPAEWLLGRVDIFHSPNFLLPPLRGTRAVLTVHDLSFLAVPECADPGLRTYLTRQVPAAVRRADLVLADSAHTKADLVRFLDVPPDKIEVLYSAAGPAYRPIKGPEVLQQGRRRLLLEPPFVLTVGTLEPRKNLVRLLEAFQRVSLHFPHLLVVVGRPGWMYEDVYRAVGRLGLHERVRFLGYVRESELPLLYNLAELFVFPSLYEGFGLPPLEAMACGTPVVCSNASSLPEVVGDAALTVSPTDVEGLAQAMAQALGEPSLRHELSRRGIQRAGRFSWQRSAEHLVGLYRRLGGLGDPGA